MSLSDVWKQVKRAYDSRPGLRLIIYDLATNQLTTTFKVDRSDGIWQDIKKELAKRPDDCFVIITVPGDAPNAGIWYSDYR